MPGSTATGAADGRMVRVLMMSLLSVGADVRRGGVVRRGEIVLAAAVGAGEGLVLLLLLVLVLPMLMVLLLPVLGLGTRSEKAPGRAASRRAREERERSPRAC